MPKASFSQTNFTAGELSPKLKGRFDIARYTNGCKTLENFLIHQAGGAMFRPGTRYVNEVKTSGDGKVRLYPFQFSTTQNYVLEFGDLYVRFYANNGQVVSGATPVEVVTPYLIADVFELQFAQSADVLYIVHNDYAPRKLERTSATSFTLTEIDFTRGPFLDDNITANTITPSADTGDNRTLTGSVAIFDKGCLNYLFKVKEAVVRIDGYANAAKVITAATQANPVVVTSNGHDLLDGDEVTIAGVVGMTELNGNTYLVNNKAANTWELQTLAGVNVDGTGYTAYVSDGTADKTKSTVVTGDVEAEPDGTAGDINSGPGATTDWAKGSWSTYQGFPGSVTFHEQRLVFAGSTEEPQKFWASVIQEYTNFNVDDASSDDSYAYEIATEQVNKIRWLSSGPKAMQIGTSGATFSASSGDQNDPITPDSIVVQRDTAYGTANILPKRIGNYVYYIQRNTYALRELGYSFDIDAQQALDMTLLSDHILRDGDGAVDMAYQQSPHNRIWIVRDDGEIAVMTRNIEQEVIAWNRIVAGADDRAQGEFESIAIIPEDSGDDQVWVVVKRYIDGAYVRYVEYFESENPDQPWDIFFLDSGLTLDSPIHALYFVVKFI